MLSIGGSTRVGAGARRATYAGAGVDGGAALQQDAGTVDVVALSAHVQRCEVVLGARVDTCSLVQQSRDHRLVAVTCRAVQRRQIVLPPPQ